MSGGWLQSPTWASWDVSARCLRPIDLRLEGVGPRPYHVGTVTGAPFGRWLETNARARVLASQEPDRDLHMKVPCRQCRECLAARARMWGRRAVSEWELAPRSWFGTLTFQPEKRYAIVVQTELRLREQGGKPLAELNKRDRFAELQRTAGPLVTRYLYALRDGRAGGRWHRGSRVECPPVRFRYILTAEPHGDGFPHYHAVVHELPLHHPIRRRQLACLWDHGFASWSVVQTEQQAFYAVKYLGKTSLARVRASSNYGKTGESASQSPASFPSATPEEQDSGAVTSSDKAKRAPIDPPTGHVSPPPVTLGEAPEEPGAPADAGLGVHPRMETEQ